jgi:DNA-binding NarL/FixJ family response regulator
LLSKREKEIALLIAKGLQSSQIANELHISEHTVTTHRKNIMRKMKVHNSMQLAKVIN